MNTTLWLGLATFAAVCWGVVYTVSGKVMERIEPLQLMWILAIIEAAGITLWFSFKKDGGFAFAGVVMNDISLLKWTLVVVALTFLSNLLIWYSVTKLNASVAAMIEISYPLFTVLAAWILFKEVQVGPVAVTGCVVVIFGIAMIYFDTLKLSEQRTTVTEVMQDAAKSTPT